MKKAISIWIIIAVCAWLFAGGLTALGEEVYINPINQDSITLDTEKAHYVMQMGKSISEGHYEIGNASQKIVFTPLGETEMDTWRYYDNAIYGGNVRPFALPDEIISLTRGFYGLDASPSVSTVSGVDFPRIPQAHIAFIEGGLFELSGIDSKLEKASDESVKSWSARILADGADYLAGWYDIDLLKQGFMLCVWKDENGYKDCHDMLFGMWTEREGYDTVLLNKDTDIYKVANESYQQLCKKRGMSYKESLNLNE